MTEWLRWFDGLNWPHFDNMLSSIVAVTVLSGIGWATIRLGLNPLSEWLGRRRAQANLLDQLACGSTVAYVESFLGVAQFVTFEDGLEQRIYHLRGAWVMVELNRESQVVVAFSITVTDRRFHYSTKKLTFGHLDIRLGKDTFGPPGLGFEGERLWLGPYRHSYLRTYYFHRAGGTVRFWLSYNMSGVGEFNPIHSSFYESGSFADDPNTAIPASDESALDSSGITVNTLTVLHPEGSVHAFSKRYILGADSIRVRLAASVPPPRLTLRQRWMFSRTRFLIGKALRAIRRE